MCKLHKITVLSVILLSFAGVAKAQVPAATIPYSCDFENVAERSNWQFANNNVNNWVIDTYIYRSRTHGLYVSWNGTDSNYFYNGDSTNSYAFRKIHFPTGMYNISLDWVNSGYSNYIYYTYIRVFLIPATTTFVGGQRYPGLSASRLPLGAIPVDVSGTQLIFRGTWSTFSNALVQVPATGDYYLVFFFSNNGHLPDLYPEYDLFYSPVIDNISINAVSCSKPFALTNTSLGNGCISLDWEDRQLPATQSWDIEYGPRGFTPGSGRRVTANSHPYAICGLQDDTIYDIYVRSHCAGGATSNYSDVMTFRYSSQPYLCRDFCNLKAPGTLCTYGQYEEFNDTIGEFYGPYADTGIINYGSSHYGDPNTMMYSSRHTVHTDPNEMDSCSGYRLHTVPIGENSAVRLGTVYGKWICQSISYEIMVDSSVADLLMLKYATVLYNPDNHMEVRKPRFLMEVLDSSNTLIDRGCYYADFTPGNISTDTSWHTGIDRFVYWHDWTPVGLNIATYHGHRITVRLTTYACGQGADAHFGYAYYTLKCQKSRIKAVVCGNDNNPYRAQFTAPEGFRYGWWSPDHPGFSSTSRSIQAELDGSVYYCDVFFGNDTSNCKFTLSVRANPDIVERQNIHAEFTYTKDTSNCEYNATFTNNSFSSNMDGSEIDYSCDYYYWDFGDGDTASGTNLQVPVTHSFPSYGSYTVMLIAAQTLIGCYDTIFKTITFAPPEVPVLHGDTVLCQGRNNHLWVEGQTIADYRWNTGDSTQAIDRIMLTNYTFTVHTTDYRGCEYNDSLHVRILLKPRIIIDTKNYIGCNPLSVTINDRAINHDSITYFWDWGDGISDVNDSSTTHHTYHTPGRYVITCITESMLGCTDTMHLNAYSYDYTKADFRWHSFFGKITKPDMFFENISAPHEPEYNYYKWEFYGDTVDTIPVGNSFEYEPTYHWPVTDNSDVGFYKVRLVAYTPIRTPEQELLCMDSIDYIIYILNDFLQFPNVITPNGDGVNDIFEIKNLLDGGNYTDNELYIYNHWGRLVYYKHNIATREDFWDPSLTNEMTGTYYYRFSAKGHTGNVQRNGVVELLR